MTDKGKLAEKGSWVEIHKVILKPGERASHIPEDTKKVPLELKARGFLLHDARLGDHVEIRTHAHRIISGVLSDVNPGYTHSFGPPIPELITITSELKRETDEQ